MFNGLGFCSPSVSLCFGDDEPSASGALREADFEEFAERQKRLKRRKEPRDAWDGAHCTQRVLRNELGQLGRVLKRE